MNTKIKILIGVLVVGVVVIGGWWIWRFYKPIPIQSCQGLNEEECMREQGCEPTYVYLTENERKYVGCKEKEVAKREEVKEIIIKHTSGGLGGFFENWKKIYQEKDNWVIENCQEKSKSQFLCCKTYILPAKIEALMKAIKNTEPTEEDKSKVITDVYSSYEISINTTQREIWAQSTGQLAQDPWNAISQTLDKRELFQMNGKELIRAISELPTCEGKEKKKIQWTIKQPESLLKKFVPVKLEGLKEKDYETFTFNSYRIFGTKTEKLGIVDSFTKKWIKEETAPERVIVPDVEISILAFKDKESFERFPLLAISVPAGSMPTAKNVEAVKIKGIEGFKYIFYGPKPKELMEPFDMGDITLFVLSKDNILFLIRGNQNLRSADATANAELVIKNLKLEEKSPLYIWEGQKIDFNGSLKLEKEEIPADVENCLKLGKRAEIFMCIDNAAKITGKEDVCDVYKRPEFKDLEPTFIETCYIFAAVGREDVSICDNLKTYTKDQCLNRYNIELTKKKNDPTICNGNAECLEYFVKISGDLKFCDMISDKFKKEWCYRDHAVTVEQCNKIYEIGGPNNPSRDYCIEGLAIQNGKPTLCEEIDDSYKLGEVIKNRCKRNFEE